MHLTPMNLKITAKYMASKWNEAEKAERRRTQFPKDGQAAFDAGVKMVERIRLA